MNTKITFLLIFLGTGLNVFSQQIHPYWYDYTVALTGNPSDAKEYYYDYDTQEAELVKNHSFKYNGNGRLLEHIESNKDISSWYQTFRYRFQYDAKDRLIYYWNEQEKMNGYESDREEQWVYDNYDMLTEYNNWSVVNGIKYIGGNSTKRTIIREGTGKVTKIELKEYSTVNEDFEVVKYWDFKYKDTGELDSIISYYKNTTLGGIMQLEEKRYDFNEKIRDYKNTDLLKFNSYTVKDNDENIVGATITYDSEGRVLVENSATGLDIYTYEENKITHIENNYKKTITYLDESGEKVKEEYYYFNEHTETWDWDGKASQIVTRTFESNKIKSQLTEFLVGEEYKKETKYEYSYKTTGISGKINITEINVYPNPTNAGFHLSEDLAQNGSVVEMIDMTGDKVYETILRNKGEEIIPKNLSPGIYFLKITKSEMMYMSKVQIY